MSGALAEIVPLLYPWYIDLRSRFMLAATSAEYWKALHDDATFAQELNLRLGRTPTQLGKTLSHVRKHRCRECLVSTRSVLTSTRGGTVRVCETCTKHVEYSMLVTQAWVVNANMKRVWKRSRVRDRLRMLVPAKRGRSGWLYWRHEVEDKVLCSDAP